MKFRKPKISTIIICFILFMFFLVLSFPFQNLKGYLFGKIHESTNILIIADTIYLSFFGWPGLGMKNVTASFPIGRSDLDISCRKMFVRPGISSLFPFLPSASLSLVDLTGGGNLYLKIAKSSSRIKANLEAEEIQLEQVQLPGLVEAIKGRLGAEGNVDVYLEQASKTTGLLNINIDNFHVTPMGFQGISFPAMNYGSMTGKISAQNGTIMINNFLIGKESSPIKGSINGELKLADNFIQSFLNLTLKIQLTTSYQEDPNSKDLVAFLKTYEKSPGQFAMRWNSSLHGMTTNFGLIIPQPVE